jgi:hypothetical protein
LKPEVKKAAAFRIPKVIHSGSSIGNNGKAPAEAYVITPRRLKNEVKNRINTEKLLTIIIST